MGFNDEFKEKVDQAESKAKNQKLAEEAGVQLADDKLNKVAGGFSDDVEPGDVLPIDILYHVDH